MSGVQLQEGFESNASHLIGVLKSGRGFVKTAQYGAAERNRAVRDRWLPQTHLTLTCIARSRRG